MPSSSTLTPHQPSSASAEVLARLAALHPKTIDLSLDRIRRLLADLDHPERRLPPVVHFAGTNGKGSTLAFLRAILEAHGATVHVFTSPHLVDFHERITVAGRPIDEADLAQVLSTCEAVNAGSSITFFEITTAAALLAFTRTPADFVLLETGLGGRLDATNVVATPVLTILTPIDLDHQAFLGDSIAAIAAEKAGILKPGVPCVVAAQSADAAAVIARRAAALAVPVLWAGEQWSVAAGEGGFVYRSNRGVMPMPKPALAGAFQVGNAGVAIAAAEQVLGERIDAAAVRAGIAGAVWPGRLQRLPAGRLTALLPTACEAWVDGAHNPAGASVLAAEVAGWPGGAADLVIGIMGSKDAGGVLRRLAPVTARCITVGVPGETASVAADALAVLARGVGIDAQPAASLDAAFRAISRLWRSPRRLLVCGSLYLIGRVLKENGAGR